MLFRTVVHNLQFMNPWRVRKIFHGVLEKISAVMAYYLPSKFT
jgi:hypothetical protein